MTKKRSIPTRNSVRKSLLAAGLVSAGGAITVATPTVVYAVVVTAQVTVRATDGEKALPNQQIKFTSPQVLQISELLPGELNGKPQVGAGEDPIQGRTDQYGRLRLELPVDWLSAGGKPLTGTQLEDLEATAFDPQTTRITFGVNARPGDAYAMLDSSLRPWLANAVQIGDKTALTVELPGSGYSVGDVTNWLTDRYSLTQNGTFAAGTEPKTTRDFMVGFSSYVGVQSAGRNPFSTYPNTLRNLGNYFNSINYDPLSPVSGDWSASAKYDWRIASVPRDWSGLTDRFNNNTQIADYLNSTTPGVSIPSIGANALRDQLPNFVPAGTVGTPINFAGDFVNFLNFGSNVRSIGRDLCMTKQPARRLDGRARGGAQEPASLPAATIHWESQ